LTPLLGFLLVVIHHHLTILQAVQAFLKAVFGIVLQPAGIASQRVRGWQPVIREGSSMLQASRCQPVELWRHGSWVL
jgi:hypothetical protein